MQESMEDKKENVVFPSHLGKKHRANWCQHNMLISPNSEKVSACSDTERERKNIAFQYSTSAITRKSWHIWWYSTIIWRYSVLKGTITMSIEALQSLKKSLKIKFVIRIKHLLSRQLYDKTLFLNSFTG